MPVEKSIGAAVFRKASGKTEFLLLHYPAGHWSFPKGRVEKNETEEQTLARELREETGITDARVVPGFRERNHYFFKENNETVSKDVFYYLVEARQEEVKLSHEHTGFQWLGFQDSLKLLTFPNTREVLKKANQFLEQGKP